MKLMNGFSRTAPPASPSPHSSPMPSSRGNAHDDKLRTTFKCPKFLGDPRHCKGWHKGFIRFMAIQQLDHVIDVSFKVAVLTISQQEDNKLRLLYLGGRGLWLSGGDEICPPSPRMGWPWCVRWVLFFWSSNCHSPIERVEQFSLYR